MNQSNLEFPRRLADGEDGAGLLIQRALAEPALGPSEQRSWHRLRERSSRSLSRWALPAVAVALLACAFVVWRERSGPELSLRAEVWSSPRALTISSVSPSSPSAPAALAPALVERPKAPARAADGDAGACEKLAKAGQYEPAAACYGRIARGTSMASELALYEKARLESKALGQSALALSTLDEHARRFPGGVLTAEVGMTRIELLNQLGKRDEALRAIDQGLRGALGRERGGDLQLLRAELLATQGDCVSALEALRLARQAGVHPARLEAIERRCPVEATAPPAPGAP